MSTEPPRRPASEREAAALASSLRLRIIRLTITEPMTNRELASALGRDPATTLHHVRKLLDAGFLEALPVRRGARGAREIPYRGTGLSWSLDMARYRDTVNPASLEAFLAELADVGIASAQITRLLLRLPQEELEEFESRLKELVDEFAARPRHPEGQAVSLFFARYRSG
ncbi:transcriptional regulator [Allokutzneria sp. NRRL B-24872]|uniref:ArsR/SmtB family transcription factor n=1 Tax=Allokutzneria sp. NRRL B-24872 TaxID=1137961 RepID=UPI000A37C190|nr:transcriptional regulator [Allokutzneria sp. NRRL B-24872]